MASYLTNDSFAILTGTALRFYDGRSETPVETLSMEGAGLANCRFENGCVIITATGGGLSDGAEITVYNSKGKAIQSVPFGSIPTDIRYAEDTLYLLTSEELTVSPATGKDRTHSLGGNAVQLLFDEDGTPVVFEKNLTYRLTAQEEAA